MKLYDVYPLYDIEITEGQGCRVFDSQGREYLDFYGGHAVISVGHCHPRYVNAIVAQAEKLGFYSNSVVNSLQIKLAQSIGRIAGLDDSWQMLMVNSGAEANENALKLASFHTGRRRVVAFGGAFHGRTSAAVEATDNPRIQAPLNANGNVTFVPLGDISALKAELEKNDVAAVIIEGIQGVGGVREASSDFWKDLRRLTREHGAVLIADEVQSGYGRTGRFFAFMHHDVMPDIITCAKGMGNGFPVGAVLISGMFTPEYGQLGTTFGGNHTACAAAQAVVDIMADENLTENAASTGEYLIGRLRNEFSEIAEVRGRGLMIGIQFDFPVKELRANLINYERVFTGASGNDVLRLLPPLTVTRDDADDFLCRLRRALNSINNGR